MSKKTNKDLMQQKFILSKIAETVTNYSLKERTYDLSGQTTIPELITIMKNSKCVITTDSGSAHIAGASAKNIISIHGPTNFYQSAPYSTKYNDVKVATLNLKCSPCYDTEA